MRVEPNKFENAVNWISGESDHFSVDITCIIRCAE